MTLSFEIFINKINKSISFNTTEFLMKYYLLKKKLRNKIIKKKKKQFLLLIQITRRSFILSIV